MEKNTTYITRQSPRLRAMIGAALLLALMPLGSLGGVEATGMSVRAVPLSAAAQATPVPDPDLCAYLRSLTQGGAGFTFSSSNPKERCSITNDGDGSPAPIDDIVVVKHSSPEAARADLQAKYKAATANNFGRWDPVTYFGDEGYGYEIMAINLNDPGGAFARGCYTAIGHSARYPASNQPLLDALVRLDQALKSAPCGGGTPDKAPPDAITVTIPGKSAPCSFNRGLDTQIKLRVWSGPVRAESDKVPFFIKSSDGTTLGNTQVTEYVEYRYTTAAVDTMFTSLQPGYVVTLPSTVPKNTKDKWKISAEFPDGTIVQLGPTGSLKIPCNPAEPLQMTGVAEILTKQSSTINTFSVGNANITAGSGRFFNVLGPTNQSANIGARISINATDPAKTGVTVYVGSAQVSPKSGGTGVTVTAGQRVDVTQSSVTPPVTSLEVPGVDNYTFPETGKIAAGIFMDYWQTHGGLAQQGYPISGLIREKSDLNGQTYTVQYFERAVFEFHPEYSVPNDVLLSQLGTFQYKRKYPNGAPNQKANTSAGSRLFTETGKRVGGKFLDYWNTHGGLAQQGFPLSEEFTEVSETDGKTYLVQYFERAVFEFHPEFAPPNDVLLSLLGNFFYKQKYGGGGGPGPVPTATPVGGGGTNCSATTNIAAASNGGSIAGVSSNYGDRFGPEKMIDGNPKFGWSTASGQKANQYVIVALPRGQTYSINKVRLNPYTTADNKDAYKTDSVKNFQIRVSTTDANVGSFRTVYSGLTPMQDAFFDFTFPATQAKYVMLFVVDNYGGDFVEAAEFEVYEACAGGGGNPTPVATPTSVASGQCSGIPANQNMTVTPSNCARAGTDFVFEAAGFNPGEGVQAAVTAPDGRVYNASNQLIADQNGAIRIPNAVTLETEPTSLPGLYTMVMEGVTSRKKATGYIRLLAP